MRLFVVLSLFILAACVTENTDQSKSIEPVPSPQASSMAPEGELAKACAGGDEAACKLKSLIGHVMAGRDTSRSMYESEYEYQCYEADYQSCLLQGDRYYEGNGPAKNIRKAADFYLRACSGGNIGRACHQLGLMTAPSDTGGDLKQSLAFLEQGCNAKYADSCGLLFNIYMLRQHGLPRDLEKLKYYRKKLCEATPTAKCQEG